MWRATGVLVTPPAALTATPTCDEVRAVADDQSTLQTKSCNRCRAIKPLPDFSVVNKNRGPQRHSVCRACRREQFRQWSKTPRGRERKRVRVMAREYNLSVEDYDALHATQGGVCAICRRPESYVNPRNGTVQRLCVDHDHLTGKVRGLLCRDCNGGLGLYQDDSGRLRAAANYLDSSRAAV